MTELTGAALGRVRSRLIPFLFVLYLVAYLDRLNICFSHARTQFCKNGVRFNWAECHSQAMTYA